MKEKRYMTHDPEDVMEKLGSAFTMMKIWRIHRVLVKLGLDYSQIIEIMKITYINDYKIAIQEITKEKSRKAVMDHLTVGWLYLNGFSINQMMKYQGCAQSKIYKSLDYFDAWMDGTKNAPQYSSIAKFKLVNSSLDKELDSLLETLNLLQFRKV